MESIPAHYSAAVTTVASRAMRSSVTPKNENNHVIFIKKIKKLKKDQIDKLAEKCVLISRAPSAWYSHCIETQRKQQPESTCRLFSSGRTTAPPAGRSTTASSRVNESDQNEKSAFFHLSETWEMKNNPLGR